MSAIISSARPRGGSFRLLVPLLITLAAPFFLYLVGRTAAVGLNPPIAASLPPTEYSRLLRRIIPAVADPRLPVPPTIVDIAKRGAFRQPLAYEPYFILGKDAGDHGDVKRAIRLMEESRRRRPNHLLTRLLLATYYGGQGRYSDALAELDYTMRSSDAVRTAVFPEVVKTMRTAEGLRAVGNVLAKRPQWRDDFLLSLKRQEALDVAEARQLLNMVQAGRPGADWSPERDLYIDALVRAGDAAQARSIWLQQFPSARRESYRLLVNGDFAGSAMDSPFSWSLHEQTAGRAEIVKAGPRPYLQVDYFGGETVVLAEQLLALAPGTYQLTFGAKSDEGIKSGSLYWSVSCAPAGSEISRVRLSAAQAMNGRMQGLIVVPPSGCTEQKLRLIAEAGDVVSGYTAQISNMQLVRR